MKKLLITIVGMFISVQKSSANDLEWSIIPSGMSTKFEDGKFTTGDIVDFGFHIIKLLIDIAGVVALILIMIGGYKYVIGSYTDDKESEKNT